jgi:hypothetical protein
MERIWGAPLCLRLGLRSQRDRADRWPVWKGQIEEKGHYDWHVRIAGKNLTVPVRT